MYGRNLLHRLSRLVGVCALRLDRILKSKLLKTWNHQVTLSMDKLGLGNHYLDRLEKVSLLVVEVGSCLFHRNSVSMTILVLQIVGRAKDDEAAIHHDCELVAELFSFVHAMSGEQD